MLRNFHKIHGCNLSTYDGEIGKVREVYFDDDHWKVRYLVVTTGSWLTGREVLIAPWVIEGIDEPNGLIAVNLTREEVRESPPVESDKPVSRQYEELMYKYYGWDPYWSFSESRLGYGMSTLPPVAPARVAEKLEPAPEVKTHLRSSGELKGYQIQAQDGELGKVEDFIIDDVTWTIRYLVVRPGSWLTQAHVLLSPEWIEKVSFENAEVVVNLPAEAIRNAPVYAGDGPITREYEDQLHVHYDRQAYWLPRN